MSVLLLRLGLALFLGTLVSGTASASDSLTRYLALAGHQWLTLLIGKYDPAHGWIRNDTFYYKPPQRMTFTLFGLPGKLGEVQTINAQLLPKAEPPWEWSLKISSWNWSVQDQALAINGSWPTPARLPVAVPLDDPGVVAVVSEFLKSRHLDVPAPTIRQACKIDLLGDHQEELLICARSDVGALRDESSAPIYSVVLFQFMDHGKTVTVPLAAHTSFKPAIRSLDDQKRYYGEQPDYQVLAFVDIEGDGRLEIVLKKVVIFRPDVHIFTFDGHTAKQALASYKIENE